MSTPKKKPRSRIREAKVPDQAMKIDWKIGVLWAMGLWR